MEETILRQKVWEELQSGEPFDMEWVTCDRKRGTGGDYLVAEGWMKVGADDDDHGQPAAGGNESMEDRDRRDPDHAKHFTINIFNPGNSGIHPHKVHIDLIQFFNGKRVIN